MKVFIDLEVLIENLNLEEVLYNLDLSFSNLINGYKKRNNTNEPMIHYKELDSLPLNFKIVNILFNNYINDEIVLMCKDKYINYANHVVNLFLNSLNIKIMIYENEKKQEHLLNVITEEDHYISDSFFSDSLIHNKVKGSSVVSNVFIYLVSVLFLKNNIISRNSWFYGVFSVFFSYIKIILPIISIWPMFFEGSDNLYSSRLMYTFYSVFLGSFLAGLWRSVVELHKERKFFVEGYNPLCAEEFILYSSSIKVGLIYIFLSLFCLIFILFIEPIGVLGGMFISFIYYLTYILRLSIKLPIIALTIFLTQSIIQFKFIKIFFSTLFGF